MLEVDRRVTLSNHTSARIEISRADILLALCSLGGVGANDM